MSDSNADRVKKIIVSQLNVSEGKVTPEASFIDDLGADSLDQVELVMALEEEFNTEIPEEEAEKLQTVGSVISYVDGNLSPSQASSGDAAPSGQDTSGVEAAEHLKNLTEEEEEDDDEEDSDDSSFDSDF